MALLGAEAGVGAGGVDEGEDGQAEFLGELHEAEGLAVALGLGHAEVAGDLFLGVAAFLLGDDHDGLAVEEGGAADEGAVVAELAVAVQFLEAGAEQGDVVEGVGAARVAGDLHALPRGEAGVDLALGGGDLFLDAGDLLAEIEVVLEGLLAELFQLGAQVAQGFLKLERVNRCFHEELAGKTAEAGEPPGSCQRVGSTGGEARGERKAGGADGADGGGNESAGWEWANAWRGKSGAGGKV